MGAAVQPGLEADTLLRRHQPDQFEGGSVHARYSEAVEDNPTRPLYRYQQPDGDKKHFFSVDEKYEGKGTNQRVLGHVAKARGGEMLRALRRCKDSKGGRRMHSLDLLCDVVDGDGEPLGFMR